MKAILTVLFPAANSSSKVEVELSLRSATPGISVYEVGRSEGRVAFDLVVNATTHLSPTPVPGTYSF